MSQRFVVDASVTLSWCFSDEGGALAEQTLDALQQDEVVVPAIWTLEVANVLLVAERRGRLTRADSEQFLALLENYPIIVDTHSAQAISGRILALGRDYGLSSYDAAYLELAMREGISLATTDAALLRAMSALGISPWQPSIV